MKRMIAAGLGVVAAAVLGGSAIAADTTSGLDRTDEVVRQQAASDIVDTAIGAGDFTTLVAAVQAAGLEDTLRGAGPFTVFAPTDAAFAALPAGTVDSLLANPEQLRDILLYHVVAGEVLAADVVGLSSATAANGDSIAIAVVNGGVVLNGSSNVIATDVMASNGVIHVIDAVILPPADAAPAPGATGNAGIAGIEGTTTWLALAAGAVALVLLGGARLATARRNG